MVDTSAGSALVGANRHKLERHKLQVSGGDAAGKVRLTLGRRRRRFECRPHLVELTGEVLELANAFGDLGLLLVDELADPVMCGCAVRATPHREKFGDLIAAQPHPACTVHEQELGRRVFGVVAVPGPGAVGNPKEPDPLVVAHRRRRYADSIRQL